MILLQFTMLMLWTILATGLSERLLAEKPRKPLACKTETCRNACGMEYRYIDDTFYTCQCDADCIVYGDCCKDFEESCLPNTFTDNNIPIEYMTCRSALLFKHKPRYFWMIGKCPADFKDPEIRDRCENDLTSPMTKMPVNVGKYYGTFANIYCAYCHDITVKDYTLLAWQASLTCYGNETNFEFSKMNSDLSDCNLFLQLPTVPPRPCLQPSVIVDCEDVNNFDNASYLTHSKECKQYQLLVGEGINIYKNPDCAKCSSENENLECIQHPVLFSFHHDLTGPEFSGGRFTPSATFNIMFNFNRHGTIVKIDGQSISHDDKSCDKVDEVYDRILQVCTKLHCPYGSMAINGSCISQNYTTRSYSLRVLYRYRNMNETLVKGIFKNWLLEIALSQCLVEVENSTEPSVNNTLNTFNATVVFDVDLFSNCSLRDLVDTTIRFIRKLPIPAQSMEVYMTSSRTFHCDVNKNQMVSLSEYIRNHSIPLEFFDMRMNLLFDEDESVIGELCVNKDYLSGLNCPSVVYLPGQFVKRKNSLKLVESGLIIPSDQFIIHKVKAYVCLNYSQEIWTRRMLNLMSSNRILEYSVIGTSVTCCILTLVVYITLPQLRNTPGKIIMSLTISIILAQSICLMIALPSGTTCILVAWMGHSQWLSVFLWMSMMAIDVAHSLKQSIAAGKSGNKTYLAYAGVAWGCPMVAVGILIVLDYYGYVGMKYGFGSMCWIGSDNMLLYTLIIPIATCILVNLGCFVVVILAIKPDTKLLGKSNYAQRKKQMAKVFAKLSVLTGFTWVIMYLAVVFNGEVLWRLNILFNGSSGLYIFVCFVCNKRTLTMLKENFFLKSRSPSTYMSTISTTSEIVRSKMINLIRLH